MPPATRVPKSAESEDRFVEEYLASGQNATVAYQRTHPRSGYDSARANAARLIAKASVRKKIRAARRRLRKQTGVKGEEIVAELMKIAFADIGDVFDFSGDEVRLRRGDAIAPEARQAIRSIDTIVTPARTKGGKPTVRVKVQMADKLKALESLARMRLMVQLRCSCSTATPVPSARDCWRT